MIEQATLQFKKTISISLIMMLLFAFASILPVSAKGQSSSNSNSRVSRTKKTKLTSACIVEILNSTFETGEYLEIIDSNQRRLGTAKAGRKNSKTNRATAVVIDGSRNCNIYKGKNVRKLITENRAILGPTYSAADKSVFIIPQYIVTQYTVPGLALNKFISPSYNQKGFGLRVTGVLPKRPFQIARFNFKTHVSAGFESAQTSPAIDLLRDQLVQGNQSISSTRIDARGGVRALFAPASSWAEIGAVLYESTTSKSSLNKTAQDEAALFQAIRDVSGSTFGLYAGFGALIADSSEISIYSGIGLGGSYTTPIIEDGSFTNTSETLNTEGIPLFAEAAVKVPLLDLLFVEVNLQYKNIPLLIPLINDETSKAQSESLSFRVGAGLQF